MHAARVGQAEVPRLLREALVALPQPGLEVAQPADPGEVLDRGGVLQDAGLADDLLLLGQDRVDVRAGRAPAG
jgi:hypothetical protein